MHLVKLNTFLDSWFVKLHFDTNHPDMSISKDTAWFVLLIRITPEKLVWILFEVKYKVFLNWIDFLTHFIEDFVTFFDKTNLKPCLDILISQLVLNIALLACRDWSKNLGLFYTKSFVASPAQKSSSK